MKKKNVLALLLAASMLMAAAAGCSNQSAQQTPTPAATDTPAPTPTPEPTPEPAASVAGDWTMTFTGNFGEETFIMTLNEDGTAHLATSNPMIGPWDGTYEAQGDHVLVKGLENPNSPMGKYPDLWPNWFDANSGDCEIDLNETDKTFTIVEIEGVEASGGMPFGPGGPGGPGEAGGPGGMPGGEVQDGDYMTWINEPYGDLAAQTFNGKMKNQPGARPVLVVVPGGAFRFVDGGHYSAFCDYFAERGWLVIQLNYTVGGNTYPQAIVDVKTALQYIVDNAGPLHADTGKITVVGSSAGGYLAAMATVSDADQFKAEGVSDYTYHVANLVDFFGATEWMNDELYSAVGANSAESGWIGSDVSAMNAEERTAIDPLTYLDAADVDRVWVSHGTGDTTMPIRNSEIFYEGAKAVLGDSNTHFEIIEGATHEGAQFYADENFAKVEAFLS